MSRNGHYDIDWRGLTDYPRHYGPDGLAKGDHDNIREAKRMLATHAVGYVRIDCFSQEDVDAYRRQFTEAELRRIRFHWYGFR